VIVSGPSEPDPAADRDALVDLVAGLGDVVVAFSGGVDSSVVAAIAERAAARTGARAVAVTASSPSLAGGELDAARGVAASLGIDHRVVATEELTREGYRRNRPDRCYHCKSELYDRLDALGGILGDVTVLSGANLDDLGDWRPGLRAAAEHGVRHPLLELGLGKHRVRALARLLRVPSAEKPASPCLASRIPHGTPVEPGTLARIDRAESALRARGYRILRVRDHGARARVELGDDDQERLATGGAPERAAVLATVRSAGYAEAEIAPEPFRSGSLTRDLISEAAPPPGTPVLRILPV
jgi:uncharacterized protein